MGPHVCLKENELKALKDQADRNEKEMYVGREGRQPVIVRLNSCERIVGWMVYVATALLISTMLAVGGLVWSSVKGQQTPQFVTVERGK